MRSVVPSLTVGLVCGVDGYGNHSPDVYGGRFSFTCGHRHRWPAPPIRLPCSKSYDTVRLRNAASPPRPDVPTHGGPPLPHCCCSVSKQLPQAVSQTACFYHCLLDPFPLTTSIPCRIHPGLEVYEPGGYLMGREALHVRHLLALKVGVWQMMFDKRQEEKRPPCIL